MPLSKPIIGSISTPIGKGYYMVAADGGVVDFSNKKFYGSLAGRTGGITMNSDTPLA